MFSSSICIVLFFIFRSPIHLEFIHEYSVNNGLNVIFLQMAILYIIFLNAMCAPVI